MKFVCVGRNYSKSQLIDIIGVVVNNVVYWTYRTPEITFHVDLLLHKGFNPGDVDACFCVYIDSDKIYGVVAVDANPGYRDISEDLVLHFCGDVLEVEVEKYEGFEDLKMMYADQKGGSVVDNSM